MKTDNQELVWGVKREWCSLLQSFIKMAGHSRKGDRAVLLSCTVRAPSHSLEFSLRQCVSSAFT